MSHTTACALTSFFVLALAGCGREHPDRQLTLATTTSVANSGFLDVLQPASQANWADTH